MKKNQIFKYGINLKMKAFLNGKTRFRGFRDDGKKTPIFHTHKSLLNWIYNINHPWK